MQMWNKNDLQVYVPSAGGASTFLGTGAGTFSSGTGFLGTSGTLKIPNRVSVTFPPTAKNPAISGPNGSIVDILTTSL